MKVLKGIGLYFLYPLVFLGLGFTGGICFMDYFYPRVEPYVQENQFPISDSNEFDFMDNNMHSQPQNASEVMVKDDKISVNTEYVIWEYDLSTNTMLETTKNIAPKYMGMNREQYVESMDEYESNPPLTELEKGFKSLEVISFSADRVILQMNYQSELPGKSFYLLAYNGFVVVYLEDKETIYLYTEILLKDLPFEMQQEIIDSKFVANEEELYHFLENYTS